MNSTQEHDEFKIFDTRVPFRFNPETSDGRACRLAGETRSDEDVQRICREHAYPPA